MLALLVALCHCYAMPELALLQALTPLAQAQKAGKTRPHRAKVYTELREQQAIAMRDLRDPETPPAARAQLMRAYDICEERIRIMRMRPAPKPIDVTGRKPRRRSSPSALPTVPPPPPSSAADSQASA